MYGTRFCVSGVPECAKVVGSKCQNGGTLWASSLHRATAPSVVLIVLSLALGACRVVYMWTNSSSCSLGSVWLLSVWALPLRICSMYAVLPSKSPR